MAFVGLINGIMMLFMATLMAVLAVAYPDTEKIFADSAFLCGLPGGFIVIASRRPELRLRSTHGFMLTASVWLTAALAGALPLWIFGLSPADAVFEAMSGITTTGSTVIVGLDTLPHGLLLWRAMLQGFGGIGFIATGVALLPILRVGGMQLFRTESSEKGEKEFASAGMFAAASVVVYFVLMVMCGILYWVGGMSVFDATTHAMTTLSTGGYSNYDASFGHFSSPFLQYTAILFMLAGSLPLAWYLRVVFKRTFASEQVRMLLIFLTSACLALTFWLALRSGLPLELAFRQVAFNVVSVVSTTGYATSDYTLWGPFAVAVFLMLTAVGGCTGSTAGGAKMMRWIVFFRLTGAELRRVHYPHVVLAAKYEGRVIQEDVSSGVVSFFTWYVLTCAVLALALGLLGYDTLTSISGAVTAVANVGPGVGAIIGPAGNFASLDPASKLLLASGMYLGRLEILTVFVLFTRYYWQNV